MRTPDLSLSEPPVFGLFQKRIAGDDSLLELAKLRFGQAGMGAELYAGTVQEVEHLLHFRPCSTPSVVVHLPREFKLTDAKNQRQIVELATHFEKNVRGFVIHDHAELASDTPQWLQAARALNSELLSIPRSPMLFIEYAAGLEPDLFVGFFESIQDLARVSACLDVGHIGIRRVRKTFLQMHPGQDVCALKTQPVELESLMEDVEEAVRSGLETVLEMVRSVGGCGKPVHFHLHDGHPLSAASPFGVADHLSFLSEVRLRFEYRGRRDAPLMFGPGGLRTIVERAMDAVKSERASFTLEIHPTSEQLALGAGAPLFNHWSDKTNAEKMNHWLSVLSDNQRLMMKFLASASQTRDKPTH